ncbi:MAG TPA: hypothetical protein VJ763_09480 [Sphingomicrobium sp.]|nr:hypothetical protein [Sphingomicrobium sp.]
MSRLVLPLLVLAALPACDDNPATQPSQPIVVRSEGQDRLHQLDDMNRAIALKRAIYESGSECRRVTSSGYVGEYENTSYWTATCEDSNGRTRDWALFVGPDESVQVRLCEDVTKAGLQPCVIKPGARPSDQSGS